MIFRRFQFRMAHLFVAVAIVSAVAAVVRALNPPIYYLAAEEYFESWGGHFRLWILEEDIDRAPRCNSRLGPPPVSADAAMANADEVRLRWLREKRLHEPPFAGRWDQWEPKLREVDESEGKWFWLVKFTFCEKDDPSPYATFKVAVLMDGTVIEPSLQGQ